MPWNGGFFSVMGGRRKAAPKNGPVRDRRTGKVQRRK